MSHGRLAHAATEPSSPNAKSTLRVDFDRYATARTSARKRSIAWFAGGAFGVVFASWWVVFGVLVIAMSKDAVDGRVGWICGLFAGLFPLAGSLLAIGRGVALTRAASRWETLAGLSRLERTFSARDAQRALTLDARRTEELVAQGIELGVLVAESGPANSEGGVVGTVFNRTYRVERKLGQGGMGSVFEATHLRTGRRYALKVLSADARVSPDAIRRFEREATLAGSLGHPGIVAVHDFDETEDGTHFLVMELLEGETLEARLEREGALSIDVALDIAIRLGTALAAAHDAGVLHRDLKPANVFLARGAHSTYAYDRVVLLDFGLAKAAKDDVRITLTGEVVGTPLYMSPEQARGGDLDARSDVYSLGAVVYETIAGTPPFFDRTLAEVYRRLLAEDAPKLRTYAAHVPPELEQILATALTKEPASRYVDARAFVAQLEQLRRTARLAG